MEKKTEAAVRRLMDFGYFTDNIRLMKLAAEAEARYPAAGGSELDGNELDDNELEELFAAGNPASWAAPEEDDDEH